jgi:hypothetical protein
VARVVRAARVEPRGGAEDRRADQSRRFLTGAVTAARSTRYSALSAAIEDVSQRELKSLRLVRQMRLRSAWHQCSRLLLELNLVAQRDPVGAHRGDLGLEAGTAAINGTAMNPRQAEAAALVETQGINIIVGGNDP